MFSLSVDAALSLLHSNTIHALSFRGWKLTVNYIGIFDIYKVHPDPGPVKDVWLSQVCRSERVID